ncbi:MAG: hypothetical protein JRG91_04285, partial [Deltaproteobacteria bacterium]|nr:hypothetical protein [Deltaproteobacteria bacterium]
MAPNNPYKPGGPTPPNPNDLPATDPSNQWVYDPSTRQASKPPGPPPGQQPVQPAAPAPAPVQPPAPQARPIQPIRQAAPRPRGPAPAPLHPSQTPLPGPLPTKAMPNRTMLGMPAAQPVPAGPQAPRPAPAQQAAPAPQPNQDLDPKQKLPADSPLRPGPPPEEQWVYDPR